MLKYLGRKYPEIFLCYRNGLQGDIRFRPLATKSSQPYSLAPCLMSAWIPSSM